MKLTKVSLIDYDKKDCIPVECPECKQSHFSVFEVVQKSDNHQSHIHIRCVFCDLTWCPATDLAESRQRHILELEKTCSELQEKLYTLEMKDNYGTSTK